MFSNLQKTITLILGFFFLLSFLFLNASKIFAQSASGCWVTRVGQPGSEIQEPQCETSEVGLPGGPCQEPPEYHNSVEDYRKAFVDKWGILFMDSSFSSWDVERLRWMWDTFWGIDCYNFLGDLKGLKIQSYFTGGGSSNQSYLGDERSEIVNPCPNGEPIDGDPNRYPHIFFNNYDIESSKTLMIHEMTHVWQTCKDNGITNLGGILDAQAADEKAGFGRYLTTYSQAYANNQLCSFVPANETNEDHAETIALYLRPEANEVTCGNGKPNPYKGGRFPNHLKLAKNGVGEGN